MCYPLIFCCCDTTTLRALVAVTCASTVDMPFVLRAWCHLSSYLLRRRKAKGCACSLCIAFDCVDCCCCFSLVHACCTRRSFVRTHAVQELIPHSYMHPRRHTHSRTLIHTDMQTRYHAVRHACRQSSMQTCMPTGRHTTMHANRHAVATFLCIPPMALGPAHFFCVPHMALGPATFSPPARLRGC